MTTVQKTEQPSYAVRALVELTKKLTEENDELKEDISVMHGDDEVQELNDEIRKLKEENKQLKENQLTEENAIEYVYDHSDKYVEWVRGSDCYNHDMQVSADMIKELKASLIYSVPVEDKDMFEDGIQAVADALMGEGEEADALCLTPFAPKMVYEIKNLKKDIKDLRLLFENAQTQTQQTRTTTTRQIKQLKEDISVQHEERFNKGWEAGKNDTLDEIDDAVNPLKAEIKELNERLENAKSVIRGIADCTEALADMDRRQTFGEFALLIAPFKEENNTLKAKIEELKEELIIKENYWVNKEKGEETDEDYA